MKTLTPQAIAALSAPVLGLASLVRLDFPSMPILLTDANRDISAPSGVYKGAAGIGQISQIDDSPGEIKGLQFTLSGVPIEMISLVLGDSSIVQGTPVTIRTAIFDAASFVLCDEPIAWMGYLDTMSIEETGDTCTVSATAESSAVDMLRGNPSTYSNADQQALYPGDRAFEHIIYQLNKPVVWPDRLYFIAKGS